MLIKLLQKQGRLGQGSDGLIIFNSSTEDSGQKKEKERKRIFYLLMETITPFGIGQEGGWLESPETL